MPRNMSNLDRALRAFVVAPAALIVGAVVGPVSILAFALYAIGAVMLLTAVVGSCPLYSLLGLDSRGHKPISSRRSWLLLWFQDRRGPAL